MSDHDSSRFSSAPPPDLNPLVDSIMQSGKEQKAKELVDSISERLKKSIEGYLFEPVSEEILLKVQISMNHVLRMATDDLDLTGLWVFELDKENGRIKIFVNPGRLLQLWTGLTRDKRVKYQDMFEYIFQGPLKLDFDPFTDVKEPSSK